MFQPTNFQDKTCPNHVCLLHKSLSDLKQVCHACSKRFTSYLFTLVFVCSTSNPSLFIRLVKFSLTCFCMSMTSLSLVMNLHIFLF